MIDLQSRHVSGNVRVMPTSTITANPNALANCPVCDGTGVDEAFGSPCNCTAFVSRSIRSRLAETCDVTIVVDRNRPNDGGFVNRSGKNNYANRYPGNCAKCGAHVPAEAGLRVREGQGWAVVHTIGGCTQAIATVQAETAQTGNGGVAAARAAARPNKFAGPCVRCTQTVAAGAGSHKVDGRWVVSHIGDCPTVAPVKVTGLDVSTLPRTGDVTYFGVPGSDSRLKVRIDTPTDGKWAGYIFVKDGAEYGTGRRYGRQTPGRTYEGDIVDALTAIVADPKAALLRYAELTSHCGICNRPLEDETSVARGIGPVCAKKLGW